MYCQKIDIIDSAPQARENFGVFLTKKLGKNPVLRKVTGPLYDGGGGRQAGLGGPGEAGRQVCEIRPPPSGVTASLIMALIPSEANSKGNQREIQH